jgi:hypothetical protein
MKVYLSTRRNQDMAPPAPLKVVPSVLVMHYRFAPSLPVMRPPASLLAEHRTRITNHVWPALLLAVYRTRTTNHVWMG